MTRPPLTAATLALVAVGGAVGAALRWGLGEAAPDGSGFPWTTFAINVIGSFALGLVPLLAGSRRVVLALGPGMLGGFTTLSAYAEQGRALLATGETMLAAAYLVGTLAACLTAVQLASLLTNPRQRALAHAEEADE